MTTGGADCSHGGQHAFRALKALPGLSNVGNSKAMVFAGERVKTIDDITMRRLKNRNRQRRYRAKKRLEAEMKRSYLNEHLPVLPTETHTDETVPNFKPCSDVMLAGVEPKNNISSFAVRVHCTRKWKKDAREARVPRQAENMLIPLPETAEPQAVVESNFENSISIGRRNWKADARNKNADARSKMGSSNESYQRE